MTRIVIDTTGQWVEGWSNGNKVFLAHVPVELGGLVSTVGAAHDYLEKWTGTTPEISKEIQDRIASEMETGSTQTE